MPTTEGQTIKVQENPKIYSEWLDANKSREYPFDDSCVNAKNRIPSAVFTDAFFLVTGIDATKDRLYISNISLGQTAFQVYLSLYTEAGEIEELGLIADIPYSTTDRTRLEVDLRLDRSEGPATVSGFLMLGDVRNVQTMKPTNDMTIEDNRIYLGCVRTVGSGVSGIRVGDKIYTGVVTLKEGDGVTITCEEGSTPEDVTITFKAEERVLPKDGSNLLITSDTDLLKQLIALYGSPVTSINGVLPVDGNIQLVDGVGKLFDGSDGVITIADQASESIECFETYLETVLQNIGVLNERAARVEEAQNALDIANNVMSVSLSRIV